MYNDYERRVYNTVESKMVLFMSLRYQGTQLINLPIVVSITNQNPYWKSEREVPRLSGKKILPFSHIFHFNI